MGKLKFSFRKVWRCVSAVYVWASVLCSVDVCFLSVLFCFVVIVRSRCATTFRVVFLSLFCFLFDLLFALGCGCRIIHVGFNWGSMLGKLWVLVGWELGVGFLVAALICKFFL